MDLPDADVRPSHYVSRSSASSEPGTAITQSAEAEGIRPTKALDARRNSSGPSAAGRPRCAQPAGISRTGEHPGRCRGTRGPYAVCLRKVPA
ncbi:hypothetical protein GCM10017687_46980 [Streptomyces echinatus]